MSSHDAPPHDTKNGCVADSEYLDQSNIFFEKEACEDLLNKSKARALIGQLLIYYLPMGEWWRKLARAQSRTRLIAKTFVLILRESLQTPLTKT